MRTLRRRFVSVPSLFVAAIALLVLAPVWLLVALLVDIVRGRWRLPIARLGLFGLAWAWLESTAIIITGAAWLVGQRNNRRLHYRLQAWWAASLMGALQVTTGIRVVHKVPDLGPGPVIVFCRHASLADSLVSAWVLTSVAGLQPRYVLKRELLADPCLDVVGNRLPNYFLDRHAADSSVELEAIRRLTAEMTDNDAAVIFPEGTRSSPGKRIKALERVGDVDPSRSELLAPLRHLLPPRPAGSLAMLAGKPDADVVLAWHSGFDGLDTFGGILRHLAHRPPPVRFTCRRISRSDLPRADDTSALTRWLDDRWLEMDRDVAALIAHDAQDRGSRSSSSTTQHKEHP